MFLIRIAKRIVCLWRSFHLSVKNAYAVSGQASYYPECPRKCRLQRFWEILRWNIRTNSIDSFYNIYGLDVIGGDRDEKDYIPYFAHFLIMRNNANRLLEPSSQVSVLRDKYLFFRFMETFGIPTPTVFGLIEDKRLYTPTMLRMEADALPAHQPLFLKDIDGECASYVKKLNNLEDLKQELPRLGKGFYIVQEALAQHDSISRINPGSINTIRLATVKNHGQIEVFGAVMRFGTSKTGCVDNSAAGGICVGVDCQTGKLMKYGFYKPGFGLKTESHPDSRVTFEGFEIPFFQEAVNHAIEAHRKLPRIHSIGWDIAISPTGPVFIEGNDNWELKSMQASYGGLKQQWYDCFPEDVVIPRRLRRGKDGSLP